MTSKYDTYWAGSLTTINAALYRAAQGIPVTIEIPGFRELGDRQSWHGVAEVNAGGLKHSSMAHATSLGRTIVDSGICQRWPEFTFRFTVSTAGDVLTLTTTAGSRSRTGDTGAGRRGQTRDRRDGPADHPWRTPTPPTVSVVSGSSSDPELFYQILHELAERMGGPLALHDCRSDNCPRQGVYFFFEGGEVRGDGSSRVVRVGTHALTATVQATLRGRLRQHLGHRSGRNPGGGNHRASVFRRHVGAALIQRDTYPRQLLDSWLDRHGPHEGWASAEMEIEMAVSRHIGAMPVLWLRVDEPDDRGYVERNSIALTSRLSVGLDPPSPGWLGRYAVRAEVRESGLWNVEHVRQPCDPGFLARLGQLARSPQ
jgi:hypothetical protein